MQAIEGESLGLHVVLFSTRQQGLEHYLEQELKRFFEANGIKILVHASHYDQVIMNLDPERHQVPSGPFLRFLDAFDLNDVHSLKLGIVGEDMFSDSHSSLNFIFGEARVNGASSVIALPRLDPRFYGLEFNEKRYLGRVMKEATHELGHVLGLRHCDDVRCIMHFSNCIEDTDIKHVQPCASCKKMLEKNVEKRLSLAHRNLD
ncbi:MAG TPA: archemetzincin [Candidatus Lokiarchaeia archaeon]|nr:archemetzincin [Candidatus Lokiarchaeia archaeon]